MSMAEKKITKKDRFNELLGIEEVAKVQDLVDFINHEIELLDKKSGKKAVKVTEEQVAIQGAILVALEELTSRDAREKRLFNADHRF